MSDAYRNQSVTIAGLSLNWREALTGTSELLFDPSFASTAVQLGTSWTKGAGNTGTLVVAAGGGVLAGGDGIYDVYWTVAGVPKARHGVDVAWTVDSAALTENASAGGDGYPATDATNAVYGMTLCKQVAKTDVDFTFNNLQIMAMAPSAGRGYITLYDGTHWHGYNISTTQGVCWTTGDASVGQTNALAGETIQSATFSSGYTSGTNVVRMAVIY